MAFYKCVPINNVDPTKDSFTQTEFIKLCKAGKQAQMQVGALITLNNVYCDTYEVIGVNHDDTTGTVDVMAHTQVGTAVFGASSSSYFGSNAQAFVNGTYLQAFDSDIQDLVKTMIVTSNDDTASQKVKLLSCTEVNNISSYAKVEGTVYEAFANAKAKPSLRWREAGSSGSTRYWLRTKYTDELYCVWCVHSDGSCSYANYKFELGILPVLRF